MTASEMLIAIYCLLDISDTGTEFSILGQYIETKQAVLRLWGIDEIHLIAIYKPTQSSIGRITNCKPAVLLSIY